MEKMKIRFGNERLITPSGLSIARLLLNKTNLRSRADNIKLIRTEY